MRLASQRRRQLASLLLPDVVHYVQDAVPPRPGLSLKHDLHLQQQGQWQGEMSACWREDGLQRTGQLTYTVLA